jgi:hypothetical protein
VLRKDSSRPNALFVQLLMLMNTLAQTLVFFSSGVSGILLGLFTHCKSFSLEGFQIQGRKPSYFSPEISFSKGLPHSIRNAQYTLQNIVLSDPGSASQIAGTLASSDALPHQGRRTRSVSDKCCSIVLLSTAPLTSKVRYSDLIVCEASPGGRVQYHCVGLLSVKSGPKLLVVACHGMTPSRPQLIPRFNPR